MQDSYMFYVDKLEGSYQEAYAQVYGYMMAEHSDSDSMEERMQELLDIFLIAQEEGKPIEKITGKDMEAFCKRFLSCFGWKNKVLYVLDGLRVVGWIGLVYGVFDLFFYMEDIIKGTKNLWTMTADWNWLGYLTGIMLVFAIDWIIGMVVRSIMFRVKKVSMKVLQGVSIATFIIAFIVLFASLMNENLNIWHFPLWIQVIVASLYLVLYYVLNHKRLKERKKTKVSFWDKVEEDLPAEMNTEMWKKFHKQNKRRVRRGKDPLDMEAFLDKEEKDCVKSMNLKWLYDITPFAATLFTLGTELANGNRNVFDLVFLTVFMFVCEYLVMHGLWKITKTGISSRRRWIRVQQESLQVSMMPGSEDVDTQGGGLV